MPRALQGHTRASSNHRDLRTLAAACTDSLNAASLRQRTAGRSIPSFAIFDCRVVRFIPSLAAAPGRTADLPVGLVQRLPDVLTLGIFERRQRC